jgi:hypothetical protein
MCTVPEGEHSPMESVGATRRLYEQVTTKPSGPCNARLVSLRGLQPFPCLIASSKHISANATLHSTLCQAQGCRGCNPLLH